MSTWFKKKPNNAEKKPFLNELFRILAMEERYQRGELGKFPFSPLRALQH